MARTTSFTLGAELDGFVREQVDSGAYASASEVVRDALARLAEEQRKEAAVLAALDQGMASGPTRPAHRPRSNPAIADVATERTFQVERACESVRAGRWQRYSSERLADERCGMNAPKIATSPGADQATASWHLRVEEFHQSHAGGDV